MVAPRHSYPPLTDAASAPADDEIEREAGRLALRLAEIAAMEGDPLEAAREMLSLLAEALRAPGLALYQRSGRASRPRPVLETLAACGIEAAHAATLRTAATRALAEGRLLALPPDDGADTDAEGRWRVLALPLGGPKPQAALVCGWPAERVGEHGGWRLALLVRVAPTLAVALRPVIRHRTGSGSAADGALEVVAPVEAAAADGVPAAAAHPDLLTLLAHDLRTPLNTMNGFVEIVLDGLAGPLTERQREFLTYAHKSTRHLTRLLEDMLFLSRGGGRRSALRRGRIEVSSVIQGALAHVREAADARRVTVVQTVVPGLPHLLADEARLTQALDRLLFFAIARAPEGGTISLEATSDGRQMMLALQMPGANLRPAELARLFEPARPQAGSISPGQTGLELAVVHRIVSLHGGEMRATGHAEGGIALTCTLPLGES